MNGTLQALFVKLHDGKAAHCSSAVLSLTKKRMKDSKSIVEKPASHTYYRLGISLLSWPLKSASAILASRFATNHAAALSTSLEATIASSFLN